MVAPDGAEYPNRGEYVEVDKPGRIVFTEPDTGITATITLLHTMGSRVSGPPWQVIPTPRQSKGRYRGSIMR